VESSKIAGAWTVLPMTYNVSH